VVDTEIRKEVIIVDDCSTDGTRQMLENMAARQANGETFAPAQDGNDAIELRDLRFFLPGAKPGKRSALRRGCASDGRDRAGAGRGPGVRPARLRGVCSSDYRGPGGVVYGSRFLAGRSAVHYFWHYVANKLLTLLSDISTNLKLTDMETCYKVFPKEVLQGIEIKSDRFGIRTGDYGKDRPSTSGASTKCRSVTPGRTYEEGKKIT